MTGLVVPWWLLRGSEICYSEASPLAKSRCADLLSVNDMLSEYSYLRNSPPSVAGTPFCMESGGAMLVTSGVVALLRLAFRL